jgi:hypothetical protein
MSCPSATSKSAKLRSKNFSLNFPRAGSLLFRHGVFIAPNSSPDPLYFHFNIERALRSGDWEIASAKPRKWGLDTSPGV